MAKSLSLDKTDNSPSKDDIKPGTSRGKIVTKNVSPKLKLKPNGTNFYSIKKILLGNLSLIKMWYLEKK